MSRVGTVLSERSDRDVDEARVHGAKRVEADAARGHLSRRRVLQEEVRAGDESHQPALPRVALEIDDDASLAAIERVEAKAPHPVGKTRVEGRLTPRRRAAWRLDLDDVGTQARENEGGELGSRIGEIE